MARSGRKALRGIPSVDIFQIAGKSISGYFPSYKSDERSVVKQPFTSLTEFALGLYLEYHPWVRFFQRGDVDEDFIKAHRLVSRLTSPFALVYEVDGQAHHYLPDWVGTLANGGLLIAEAGITEHKLDACSRAKALTARRLAVVNQGQYWIGTEDLLLGKRHNNWIFLHARRQSFRTYEEISSELRCIWGEGVSISVRQVTEALRSRWSPQEVEAAAWKLAGDEAAMGRLLVDLRNVVLDLDTPISLLDAAADPILPDPLPDDLDTARAAELKVLPATTESRSHVETTLLPGPPYDGSGLPESVKLRFHRNLAAVLKVVRREASLRAVASEYGYSVSDLCYLTKRARQLGEVALVPNKSYQRKSTMEPEFVDLIIKMYKDDVRLSVRAIQESPELVSLAANLTEKKGRLINTPGYDQVWRIIFGIKDDPDVMNARSGLKHIPRGRMSARSFVLAISGPAHLCQVDEHYLDILITTHDGDEIVGRVYAGVLVCVKTGAILSYVLSTDRLCEEDYMVLLKRAMEPKDAITDLFQCKNSWPCAAKPSVVFSDRGKVFISKHATEVIVQRLGIIEEIAPPWAPSAKGTVEALFKWVVEKFSKRLPGTTKSNPADRGAYDSQKEARRAGITFDVLEELFVQAIVDGYMREGDALRGNTHINLWNYGVEQFGVPVWLGTRDELLLLLKKSANRKNQAGKYKVHPSHGVNFRGRWYVCPVVMDRLNNKLVEIRYDRRDISVIYLFLEGEYVGEAYCVEFGGRRVSEKEAEVERRANEAAMKSGDEESRTNRTEIYGRGKKGRSHQKKETRRLETARRLDNTLVETHPAQVLAVKKAIQEHGPSQPQVMPMACPEHDGLPKVVPNDSPIPVRVLRTRQR